MAVDRTGSYLLKAIALGHNNNAALRDREAFGILGSIPAYAGRQSPEQTSA
jgi:hypothetical protein